ncbi:MAG: PBP1A family penicillin-binding protein [Actinobacteria bacterium]|nr:PBP1A family penicillin-binding protein [Actinomycetota bacterium]
MRIGRETRSARKRRAQYVQRRRIIIVLAVLLALPLIGLGIWVGIATFGLHTAAALQKDIPSLEDQHQVSLAETTQIYAADGTLLAYLHGVENRTVISGKQIPDSIKHAIVSVEDERFYQHNGVDAEGFIRALVTNLKANKVEEGFSTITMQLVGNLYLDRRDISLTRKFDEMALAWQFEKKYSKDEILDMYLNTVYFGSNAYGIEAAAKTYFDKDPTDLTLAEAALLAGLPQAPSAYSPRNHPQEAVNRRNLILVKMYEQGFIPLEEARAAIREPLKLAPYSPYTKVQEPYVVAYVRKQLIDMFGEDRVFKGGLRVETTINPAYQKLGMEAISSTLNQKGDPSAALVSIETQTGYIRAMVGGSDYDSSKFNLAAQGRRQPGSAFKTFVLTAAIESGIDPYDTYYESMPVSLTYPGAPKPWNVKTYGNNYYGTSSLVQATLRSDNTVYAQLALDVGVDHIVDVAHRMGITSFLNPDPAIALGGLQYGVSPLEMASAYATLANHGEHIEPTIITKVTDSKGNVVWEAHPKQTQAISAGVAYEVTRILQQNILSGTGKKANIDRPAAGKTGTAQENYDAWFCGYTPNLSTAVWMGHPEAQIAMDDVHGIHVTGGSFPAEMWNKFMYEADRDYPEDDFPVPTVKVNWDPFFHSSYAVPPTSSTTSSTSSTTTTLPTTDTTLGPPPTEGSTTTVVPTTSPPTTAPPTTGPTSPPSTVF